MVERSVTALNSLMTISIGDPLLSIFILDSQMYSELQRKINNYITNLMKRTSSIDPSSYKDNHFMETDLVRKKNI